MNKYFIKKTAVLAVSVIIAGSFSACGKKEKVSDDTVEEITTATPTEATTTEEITTEEITTEAPRVYTIEDVNARNEETEEWTEEDWISYAGEMFFNACDATWAYVESPVYKMNYNEVIEQDGREFYQSSYQESIKGATEEYYKVFAHSEESEAKFKNKMIEKDGKLYIDIESRDKDKYYFESEVMSIDEYRTNMIFFTVQSRYYDSEYFDSAEEHINTQDRVFSLKYEGGKWKVYDFTIPY